MDNGLIHNTEYFNLDMYKPSHATKSYAIKNSSVNSEITAEINGLQEADGILKEFKSDSGDIISTLISVTGRVFNSRSDHGSELYNSFVEAIENEVDNLLNLGDKFKGNISPYKSFLALPEIEGLDGSRSTIANGDILNDLADIYAQINSFQSYKKIINNNIKIDLKEYVSNGKAGVDAAFVTKINKYLFDLNKAIQSLNSFIGSAISKISGNGGAIDQYTDFRNKQLLVYRASNNKPEDRKQSNIPKFTQARDNVDETYNTPHYYDDKHIKPSVNNSRWGHSGAVPSSYKPGKNRFEKSMDDRVKTIMDRAIAQLGLE